MEKIIKSLVIISFIFALGLFSFWASCNDAPNIPQKTEIKNPYAGTTWVSNRLEFFLANIEGKDDTRLSMHINENSISLEFLPSDDYYILTISGVQETGKYKTIGGDRLITLKPENNTSTTLTIDTTSKEKKLLMAFSGGSMQEILTYFDALSHDKQTSELIKQIISTNEATIIQKIQAEFTQRPAK